MRVFLRNTYTRLACHDGGGHSLRAAQKRAIIVLTQNAASCPIFHEGVDYQSKKRDKQDYNHPRANVDARQKDRRLSGILHSEHESAYAFGVTW